MKKLILATLVVAMIGTSAFAMDGKKVSYRLSNSFNSAFIGAINVHWSVTENYIKAVFDLNDESFEAFYSLDDEYIGVSKKVDAKQLPASAIAKINKEYASYRITDVLLFEQDGVKKYYASLSNGSRTQILEVSLTGSVAKYNN